MSYIDGTISSGLGQAFAPRRNTPAMGQLLATMSEGVAKQAIKRLTEYGLSRWDQPGPRKLTGAVTKSYNLQNRQPSSQLIKRKRTFSKAGGKRSRVSKIRKGNRKVSIKRRGGRRGGTGKSGFLKLFSKVMLPQVNAILRYGVAIHRAPAASALPAVQGTTDSSEAKTWFFIDPVMSLGADVFFNNTMRRVGQWFQGTVNPVNQDTGSTGAATQGWVRNQYSKICIQSDSANSQRLIIRKIYPRAGMIDSTMVLNATSCGQYSHLWFQALNLYGSGATTNLALGGSGAGTNAETYSVFENILNTGAAGAGTSVTATNGSSTDTILNNAGMIHTKVGVTPFWAHQFLKLFKIGKPQTYELNPGQRFHLNFKQKDWRAPEDLDTITATNTLGTAFLTDTVSTANNWMFNKRYQAPYILLCSLEGTCGHVSTALNTILNTNTRINITKELHFDLGMLYTTLRPQSGFFQPRMGTLLAGSVQQMQTDAPADVIG